MEKGRLYVHGSWQAKAELLLGFCLVTDVSGCPSGIKKKSQKPPQERWRCGQDGVCHRNKGDVCTLWKGSRWRAWQEMSKGSLIWAPVWQLSECMRLDRFFFDIRGLLSDTKSCWWLLSQGRGEPGAPSTPGQVRASPAPAESSGCRITA